MLGRKKKEKTTSVESVETTVTLEGKDVERVKDIQASLQKVEAYRTTLARNLDFILAGYVSPTQKVVSINIETGEVVLAEKAKK